MPGVASPLSKYANQRLGKAMHDYSMLADQDRILIAVSGGIDSLVLSWILPFWEKKAPITYTVHPIHVDMEPTKSGPGPAAQAIKKTLSQINLPLTILPAAWRPSPQQQQNKSNSKDVCFQCARSRRTQLFEYARQHNYTKIALGHHRDDIIETFFLNLTSAGNISTMRPKQDLFSGRLSLIRPMAYLDKQDVHQIGTNLNLKPIRSPCPLSENTRREEIHELAEMIYQRIPGSKEQIFAALSNVRQDYLLNPTVTGSKEEN